MVRVKRKYVKNAEAETVLTEKEFDNFVENLFITNAGESISAERACQISDMLAAGAATFFKFDVNHRLDVVLNRMNEELDGIESASCLEMNTIQEEFEYVLERTIRSFYFPPFYLPCMHLDIVLSREAPAGCGWKFYFQEDEPCL